MEERDDAEGGPLSDREEGGPTAAEGDPPAPGEGAHGTRENPMPAHGAEGADLEAAEANPAENPGPRGNQEVDPERVERGVEDLDRTGGN